MSASTTTRAGTPTWMLAVTVLAYLATAIGGFLLGFAFVQDARGGALMAVAAGLNGALFCTLLADWLITRFIRRRPSR